MRNIAVRIALWAGFGLLVSVCWGFYFAGASKNMPIDPTIYALAKMTQPATAAALYLNPLASLSLTWVMLANAAAYAMLGLIAVAIQKHRRTPQISN
jgi:hypothetical protein